MAFFKDYEPSDVTNNRRDKIAALAALVTPGLLQANGMQELPVQAHLSVELALQIEKEVEKRIPAPEDPDQALKDGLTLDNPE